MIEICVVLVIAGILVSMSIPSLMKMKRHQQLQSVAQSVATDIQQARGEAVRRGTSVQLRFSAHPAGSCHIIHTGSAGQCKCQDNGLAICTGSGAVLKLEWLPKARKTTIRSNVASMRFDARIGTVSPAGSIDVANVDGEIIRHVVSIMGRMRTCTTTRAKSSLPDCNGKAG